MYTMEYYSAIKEEMKQCQKIQINPWIIIPSELSQIEKDKYDVIYMQNFFEKNTDTNKLIGKTETDPQTHKRLLIAKEGVNVK